MEEKTIRFKCYIFFKSEKGEWERETERQRERERESGGGWNSDR